MMLHLPAVTGVNLRCRPRRAHKAHVLSAEDHYYLDDPGQHLVSADTVHKLDR